MWKNVDKLFLALTALTVLLGFIIFSSASLGLLAKSNASISGLFFTQIVYGIVLGSIALGITALIPYRWYQRWSLYFYIGSILFTLLVFVPGIGLTANGATRWLDLGFITIQPAEVLKIGVVLYLATYLARYRKKLHIYRWGLIPFLVIVGIPAGILLLQPDTGTTLVILAAGAIMYFAAGAPWRDVGIIVLLGIMGLIVLSMFRPYVFDRVKTFVFPGKDLQGSGYQIHQSLIAIGSGSVFGRGLGQSVQKFKYLPEPIGDSIFAVYAEETGFVGSLVLLFLILALFTRGLHIAARAPNYFSALTVLGIIATITTQSLLNIGSMLKIFPLTGLPLIFVSHGGTALLVALASVGIILNISRYTKKI